MESCLNLELTCYPAVCKYGEKENSICSGDWEVEQPRNECPPVRINGELGPFFGDRT